MSLTVHAPGLLSTVQDRGRPGHAALGVGSAGAADEVALRLANALVGNARDAAALEFTLVGPRLQLERDALIALTGDCTARCDGDAVPAWRPLRIAAGATLECGALRRGARGYLAVAGGIALPAVLGSRSTDVNAGIGPLGGRALRAGDVLPMGVAAATAQAGRGLPRAPRQGARAANWALDPAPWFDATGQHPLRLLPGSHLDDLDPTSRAALWAETFRIGADSNRVGWRLDGPRLALAAPLQLVSTGVMPGTVQLPPDGTPIVLGVEAPTSGGYPRLGHVIAVDLPRLAQRRPGDALRFAPTDLAAAQRRLLRREQALADLEARLHARLTA